jgi:hypothetical protein
MVPPVLTTNHTNHTNGRRKEEEEGKPQRRRRSTKVFVRELREPVWSFGLMSVPLFASFYPAADVKISHF